MNAINEVMIGQKLTVKSYLKRVKIRGNFHTKSRKVWEEVKLWKEKEVQVIGVRKLSNGTIEYMGEEGVIYHADEWITAILVVKSLYSKPFPIPITYFVTA